MEDQVVVYPPNPTGEWKCPKCGFMLYARVINPLTGAFGAKTNGTPEPCANGCGEMVPYVDKELRN